MKELEVIIGGGIESWCSNCSRTRDVVKKVVSEKYPDVNIKYVHINISRPESIKKYGNMLPPVIIIKDVIAHEGSIPTESIVEKIMEHFLN